MQRLHIELNTNHLLRDFLAVRSQFERRVKVLGKSNVLISAEGEHADEFLKYFSDLGIKTEKIARKEFERSEVLQKPVKVK